MVAESGGADPRSGAAVAESGGADPRSGAAVAESGGADPRSGAAVVESTPAAAESGAAVAESGRAVTMSGSANHPTLPCGPDDRSAQTRGLALPTRSPALRPLCPTARVAQTSRSDPTIDSSGHQVRAAGLGVAQSRPES